VSRRPRLTLQQVLWFDEVYQYIKRYKCKGLAQVQAFSDMHDGSLTVEEVRPLIRKGLLRWVFFRGRATHDKDFDTIGDTAGVTVDLTDKAIGLLTPRG
jgi:hypothetical protein